MVTIVKSETLVMADVDGNNNKFWRCDLNSDHSVQVINGRVGSSGQTQPIKHFGSEYAAQSFIDKKIREKERGGYQRFKGVQSEAGKKSMSHMALEMAATEQIRTQSATIVSDLIARLIKANVHSILNSTDLKYDEDTGLFQTPLGIVTQESINDARALLDTLGDFVKAGDFTSDDVKKALASYLMLIPQKVGRKLVVSEVIPNTEAIQKQNSILDDLEASIDQVEVLRQQKQAQGDDNKKPEVPKIFSCGIDVVDDQAIIKDIQKFYESTAKTVHASYGFKIKRVYSICIDAMREAYIQDGEKMNNIMRLWHGTRPGNVLSILKSGLMIPPTSAPHVCGRMFGNGLYFSDQSTKSLNYATGWWAGKQENQCFMFLADVAMGKAHTPRGPSQNLPKAGSDSTYAVGGKSAVANNEMIVYRTSQADIRWLVEFEM